MNDIDAYKQAYQEFNDAYSIYADTKNSYLKQGGHYMQEMFAAKRLKDQCEANLDTIEARLRDAGVEYVPLP